MINLIAMLSHITLTNFALFTNLRQNLLKILAQSHIIVLASHAVTIKLLPVEDDSLLARTTAYFVDFLMDMTFLYLRL